MPPVNPNNLYKKFAESYHDMAEKLNVEYAASIILPISSVRAEVIENVVEDYEIFEYIVLRLYYIGYRDPKIISDLTGLRCEMVEKLIKTEMELYGHIDLETGNLTELGISTLKENEKNDGTIVKYINYASKRKFQVDAVTGTVIPAYIENHSEEKNLVVDGKNSILPRDTVEISDGLINEINERISEYAHKDIIRMLECVCNIESMEAMAIYHRTALLVKLDQMTYPMIILTGKRQIGNVGIDSRDKNKFDRRIRAYILSISKSDSNVLKKNGIETSELLIRDDRYFDYLLEKSKELEHDINLTDISK